MYALLTLCTLGWITVAKACFPIPSFQETFRTLHSDGFTSEFGNIRFTINGNGTMTSRPTTAPSRPGNIMDFDQYTYYTASNDSLRQTCLTDIDECSDGFTLMGWFKPQSPWNPHYDPDKTQWFISLGHGVNQQFGLQMGVRRKKLIVHVQQKDDWKKIECIPLEDDVKPEHKGYFHVSVKRRNSRVAPVYVHINGEKYEYATSPDDDIDRECTIGDYTPTNRRVTEKSKQLVIGGAYDNDSGDISGLCLCSMYDIRFYDNNLRIRSIRNIYKQGPPE